MYPWLLPTKKELEMAAFLTPIIVDTKLDSKVDLRKKLVGAKVFKRETPRIGQLVLVEPIVEFFCDTAIDLSVGVNVVIHVLSNRAGPVEVC